MAILPPGSDSSPAAPATDAMERARKIAAEIDVEHDDAMQANCRVCQRVIPFIAAAITSAVEQERQACAEIVEEFSKSPVGRTWGSLRTAILARSRSAEPPDTEGGG